MLMNHYSILLNGFIVLVSFLDDFTFMGLFFPGTVILGLVGFFASRWSSNFHALFVCALLGALMGDSVSFLWGRQRYCEETFSCCAFSLSEKPLIF